MTVLATNPQKQQIHRLKRMHGWDEDTYRNLIYQYSNGRTTSSKELTKMEAKFLIRKFSPKEKVVEQSREFNLPLVNHIYKLSFDISFLNKGYSSDTPEEKEMNIAKLNKFVMTHGVVKKPISKQNYDELNKTLAQLKGIARKEE